MTHGNTIVDRDGVEFFGNTAGLLFPVRRVGPILKMHVAGHELSKRIDDRNNRFAEVGVFHAGWRQSPRAPAILRPCVVVRERYGGTGDDLLI